MSAQYSSALAAATLAASGQHYPQGTLYVVATPIGNLADISLRALHVLQLADTVACEDTRHTQTLLRAYGIEKKADQLLALHQHNEAQAAQRVLELLQQDQRVAYVSDAGTPGVSDPGARLVAQAHASGLRVSPLPGPSSVTALISAAGIAQHEGIAGFVFAGFLPSKAKELQSALEHLATRGEAVVVLEAPHRIQALASALGAFGDRPLTVGRELTKQFEEICTLRCDAFAAWLAHDPKRTRGEFALVLHPQATTTTHALDTRALQLLLQHLPLKTAVQLASDITDQARNALYDAALALRHASMDADADVATNNKPG